MEAEYDEHKEIAIEHFFDTLAKVALAAVAETVGEASAFVEYDPRIV